eukprot:1361619-Prymnesium_polylepis.2
MSHVFRFPSPPPRPQGWGRAGRAIEVEPQSGSSPGPRPTQCAPKTGPTEADSSLYIEAKCHRGLSVLRGAILRQVRPRTTVVQTPSGSRGSASGLSTPHVNILLVLESSSKP